MRDLVMTTENPVFNPIKVEFVIESQEELEELWIRFNISNQALIEEKNACFINKLKRPVKLRANSLSAFYSIWKGLDNILVKNEPK